LVEGTSFSGRTVIELDMNVLIAKSRNTHDCVSVQVWKTLEELIDSLYLAYDSFKVRDVEVLSVIANKVQLENVKLVMVCKSDTCSSFGKFDSNNFKFESPKHKRDCR
jgi:phosphate acetyltransferase